MMISGYLSWLVVDDVGQLCWLVVNYSEIKLNLLVGFWYDDERLPDFNVGGPGHIHIDIYHIVTLHPNKEHTH